ncbi:MAG TPA: thioredoxin family protein [Myxococcota bacterium]|nr:thioredoxin family protein [Myxococcota bacterium]HQK50121.1 thioredoxin family protein [Myxococcota bacterium]
MRFFGYLLFGATLGVVAIILWPSLRPWFVAEEGGRSQAPVAVPQRILASGPEGQGGDAGPRPEARPGPEPAPAPGDPGAPPELATLCDRQPSEKEARVLDLPPGDRVRKGPGTPGKDWTWVNLWAAWCKPCKAEMPEIDAFVRRVRAEGGSLRVLFLSLDDDERQLRKYLESEDGRNLAGEVLWVKEESVRGPFYAALGVQNPPTLPVQVLLDPKGRMRCLRVGSITPAELDRARSSFGF